MKMVNEYRTLFKYDNIEWCVIIKSAKTLAKSNRYMKTVLMDIKKVSHFFFYLYDYFLIIGTYQGLSNLVHLLEILN